MNGGLLTDSTHDRRLVEQVRPSGWRNPEPAESYHLVVLGAGTAGLVAAAGAAGLGARVALVERHMMGGDCLNVGCVPSKALLASARAVAAGRRGAGLGVGSGGEARADFAAVMERLRRLRADLAPNDSAARFRALGVDVFFGAARFSSPREVEVDGRRLRFARAVIATGARPAVPEIPGLAEAGYSTNESIFDLAELPRRLVVVGGGPIGCELAQAFARLGARVTLVGRAPRLLPREDADAAELVAAALRADGVELALGARWDAIARRGETRVVSIERDGRGERLECDELLVATGRRPNVEGLGLEAAGVELGGGGVRIDDFARTTNRRILAIGDVALPWRFTHVADAAARIAIQNALFPWKKRLSSLVVPWATYTDPELAHVGLYAGEAEARGIAVESVEIPFAEVDRARLDGETAGFVRVHAERKSGRIVGATVVGRDAGELISELSTAIAGGVTLGRLAAVIHPYPTRAEAIRKAGDAWNRRRLTPSARRWLGRYFRLIR